MFYSQTLLARKTPLGTVWCAAHLQHRLSKKDYEKTKITIVVDAIMFGEVPLALRTSSYLLLGILRIFSKQVDYLKKDCDVLVMELRKISLNISAKITLPENANQAPFHSITLPDTFDLDALELGNDFDDRVPDNHLRSIEDITLEEQNPAGGDAYVAISFDEDVMIDPSHPRERGPDLESRSMEEDILVPTSTTSDVNIQPDLCRSEDVLNSRLDEDNRPPNFVQVPDALEEDTQDFGPTNQSVLNDDSSLLNVPEIEVLREAASHLTPKDLHVLPPVPDNVMMQEPSQLLPENVNQDNLLPIMEDNIPLPHTSSPFEQSAGPRVSTTSEALGMTDTHVSFEYILRSTPPQQPTARPRKRKLFFDKSTVLTNKFMKKTLEDSSDLLRERKNIPCSSLNVWKLNNSLRKEKVFYQPSITGACRDISDIFSEGYINSKCSLAALEEAPQDARNIDSRSPSPVPEAAPPPAPEAAPTPVPEAAPTPVPEAAPSPVPEAVLSPQSRIPHTVDPASTSNLEMEIEHLRNVEGNDGVNIMEDYLVASPPRFMPSPRYSEGPGSPSLVLTSAGLLSTPGQLESTIPSGFETPGALYGQMDAENATLSDIPELMNTADREELYFLEADNTPAGSQGTRGSQVVDSLSVRTRAVGRYLRNLSPIKSISGDSTHDLGLNHILEGKRRKHCARMFYEILVLKSYGLIDVQQDVPYGDISLKLTPKLSKSEL